MVAALAAPSAAEAGGFYVPEIGPRETAMAGAAVAQSSETSTTAIFHNPANLAGPTGTRIQVAGSIFLPNVEFYRRPVDDPLSGERIRFGRTRNSNRIGGAPYLGVASDVGVPNLAIGLAVHVPFGAHLVFPRDSDGRHVVTEVNLRTIYVTPTVAYKLLDRLSIGVGFNYIYADLSLDQVNAAHFVTGDPELIPQPDPSQEGITQLRGRDAASFGANIGITYTDPENKYAFGASLMTPGKLHFRGPVQVINGEITPLLDEEGNELQPAGVRSDMQTTTYPLPMIMRLGGMFRPHDQVMVEVDYNWQRWKTFDQITAQFDNNYELLPTPGAYMADVVLEQHWTNSHTLRLGTEFSPLPVDRLPLRIRAGVLLDQSPIRDKYFDLLAPDSDKIGLSVGAGYTFAVGDKVKIDADLGFMHLMFRERNIAPETVGAPLSGNDDDASPLNDSMDNPFGREVPGSSKTILNKPAPSFFHGVTRAFFDILGVGVTVRL